MSRRTGPVLAWITAGLPFGRVEVIDEWKEGRIRVALATVPDGGLCCLADLCGVLYLIARLNDGVMWEQKPRTSLRRLPAKSEG